MEEERDARGESLLSLKENLGGVMRIMDKNYSGINVITARR